MELIKFYDKGFGADSEILIDASKKGLTITEEGVSVLYNTGYLMMQVIIKIKT